MTLHDLLHSDLSKIMKTKLDSRLWSGLIFAGIFMAFASSFLSALAQLASFLMVIAICAVLGGLLMMVVHMLSTMPRERVGYQETSYRRRVHYIEEYEATPMIEHVHHHYVHMPQHPQQAMLEERRPIQAPIYTVEQQSTHNRLIAQCANDLLLRK